MQYPLRRAPVQGRHAGAGQVVGMDVVGVDIVLGAQHRAAAHQALTRVAAGPVSGIDARDAQQRHRHAVITAKAAQAAFSVHPAPGPVGGRRHRPAFVEHRATGIAIHPGGAGVHQAPQPAAPRHAQRQGL